MSHRAMGPWEMGASARDTVFTSGLTMDPQAPNHQLPAVIHDPARRFLRRRSCIPLMCIHAHRICVCPSRFPRFRVFGLRMILGWTDGAA